MQITKEQLATVIEASSSGGSVSSLNFQKLTNVVMKVTGMSKKEAKEFIEVL
jgi:hypothetical protein